MVLAGVCLLLFSSFTPHTCLDEDSSINGSRYISKHSRLQIPFPSTTCFEEDTWLHLSTLEGCGTDESAKVKGGLQQRWFLLNQYLVFVFTLIVQAKIARA